MECNKEEALRAKEVAEKKMEQGDYATAQKLLLKAQRLFPTLDNITQLTAVCEVHCAAQNKINGFDNWYGILQVEQSADVASIRKQYRKLALLLHPDKNKFFGAEAAFKLIGEANRLLTDQPKRSQYDVRCRAVSRGYVSKPAPSQPKPNVGAAAKAFANSAANQKASQLAFWTCCQFCGMRYKYLREYVNRILRCQTCNKSFIAYDVGFEGVPPGSIPGSSFVRKQVPVKAEVGKTGTSKEKNIRKDIGGGNNNVEMPKPDTAKPQPQANKPERNAAPRPQVNQPEYCAAKSRSEETIKPSVANSTIPVRKRKPDVAMNDGKSPSESRKNNKKKVVEESSESSEISNHNDGPEDENIEENDSNISQLNSREKRRSARNKRQVSYAEDGAGNDCVSTPTKRYKKGATAEGLTDNAKSANSASCADPSETAVKEKSNVMYEENALNNDRKSGGYNTNKEGVASESPKKGSNDHSMANNDIIEEPTLFAVPEPEFYDFDKDKEAGCFSVNQVWAIYDPVDNMPRFYARVKKVFSSEFKLEITWLESLEAEIEEEDGSDEVDMPIACGRFENGDNEITENRLMFSHQMRSGINRRVTLIYPKKGEAWALFRDWDVSWKTNPEKRRPPFKYDIVEIITEYSKDYGIGVRYLGKVKGFVSIFQRAEQHGILAFNIPPGEIYRFSHRVPSFRMTGTKYDAPAGSIELDPAALSSENLDSGDASDTNLNKQNVGGKADTSSKAPETEAESMAGSSNRFEKELSDKICKNLDQRHSNECLDENKKGTSSKETSISTPETKSLKKAEKANRTTEALKLRRSPRGLHENSVQSIVNHDDHIEPGDKMCTPKKLEKDDCTKDSSRMRSYVCGLKKIDRRPNVYHSETVDGSDNVMEESKSERLGSSTCRNGEENSLDKKEKFQMLQIWAVYGTNDRMPKEYVQIKRIETKPAFRLFVVSLNGSSLAKKNLLHPLCCGIFKVKNEKCKPLPPTNFSHQVQAIHVAKNTYEVYPRKGEIWALYKNENTGQCDIMEVLEEAGETFVMAGLKCVDHSESLYKATIKDVVEVPRREVARFSHQIPASQSTATRGRLRGCWKLDRSAIPGLTIILD